MEYFLGKNILAKRWFCIIDDNTLPYMYPLVVDWLLGRNYFLLIGYISNTNNPLYLGLTGCDGDSGYFEGFMDDVRKQIRYYRVTYNQQYHTFRFRFVLFCDNNGRTSVITII